MTYFVLCLSASLVAMQAPQGAPVESSSPTAEVAAPVEVPAAPVAAPAPVVPAAGAPAVVAPAEVSVPVAPPVQVAPVAPVQVAPAEVVSDPVERFRVMEQRRAGPPYYTAEDSAALRRRFDLEATAPPPPPGARWRCLIADPTCGFNAEINATSAYAYRGRQGDISQGGTGPRWNSGRAQYDLWINVPMIKETRGLARFTKMTFGPKGGVIVSDTGDTWGNLGVAGRYWLGRGRWAPTIEFTTALSYKLASRETRGDTQKPKLRMTRGPVGLTGDVGIGLGGFGAIIVGGQYDSPLAREDVPESIRTAAAGMFFIGFRGNIVWGAPAVAAVATHAATNRSVKR